MRKMRIDLKCPAEVAGTEMGRGEESWIRLILRNLTDRAIDSCEATVRLRDRAGNEIARTVHRARALKGRPRGTFSMMVPMEIPENAAGAFAVLDKVWFEDRDVWRRDPEKEKEYEPNLLPPGNELNALRYVAGNGAVGFPSQQAELWICVCGRPNSNREALCSRCGRQRETVFQMYNRNAVLRQVTQRERQLDLETRGAREETARLQRIREEEYDRKQARRKRQKRLGIALAAAIAVTAACLWGVEPALRLWSADRAAQAGWLEEAQEILTSLGSFPGAEKRLAETELTRARRDAEAADSEEISTERLEEAALLLRTTGLEPDRALADRTDLVRAERLLKAGEMAAAESLLHSLPDLEGKAGLLADCAFARGEQALAANDFEKARELFLSLGDYPEAEEKSREALYEKGLRHMEAAEYENAVSAFSQLGEYRDCGELIRRCRYLQGIVLENQGDTEAARQAYLAAGEYEDAADRAREILWNRAEGYLAAEDYASAMPLYREMDGFRDAREKWIRSATELARAVYKQREYALAASYLEDLPEDTREIRQIRTRGFYLGAKAAANRGELEEAIALMEKSADYSDAERLLRNWRLELAQQRMDAGEYAEAREILLPIAEHYQAKKLLTELEEKLSPEEPEAEPEAAEEAVSGQEAAEEQETKPEAAEKPEAETEAVEEPETKQETTEEAEPEGSN